MRVTQLIRGGLGVGSGRGSAEVRICLSIPHPHAFFLFCHFGLSSVERRPGLLPPTSHWPPWPQAVCPLSCTSLRFQNSTPISVTHVPKPFSASCCPQNNDTGFIACTPLMPLLNYCPPCPKHNTTFLLQRPSCFTSFTW